MHLLLAGLLLAAVASAQDPYVIVLGIAQDGGYPQAGCEKACCAPAWRDPTLRCGVACIGLVDPQSNQKWLFDATPDFREQLRQLSEANKSASQPATSQPSKLPLDGIFLTHAHIGHYTGLMNLGREVLGAHDIPIYCMLRMQYFLESNGPWDQLVKLHNIELRPLAAGAPVKLNERLTVTPLLVPHRDEYSETVGLLIAGPRGRVLYLPDIDKWERWDRSLETVLKEVDVAFLDGTFYDGTELPGRDLSEIPHPFMVETMNRLKALPASERSKVNFIHLNHTNPALQAHSDARKAIEAAGFHVANFGEKFEL